MTTTSILAGLGGSGFKVANSLRFRSSASAYLNRTFGTSTNDQKLTLSFWAKKNVNTGQGIFDTNRSYATAFWFDSNNLLNIYVGSPGTAQGSFLWQSTPVYRDPSAWYHVVINIDTTQATATNRVAAYINGVQITAWGTQTTIPQNINVGASGNPNTFGFSKGAGSAQSLYWDGYMAEVYWVDGQALTPSSFGTYDTNGVWQPINYSGTYGTNGFHLPFTQSSSFTYAANVNNGYVTAPTSTAFAVGTNAFTMETWFYPTSSSFAGQFLFVASNGIQFGFQNSTTWGLAQANVAWLLTTTTLPTVGQWNHLAIVRSGVSVNQTAIFLNGVRVAQGTVATTFAQNTCISGQSINGYMSNVRLVNGTAIYSPASATITVPTAPLTNVTNTSLLTFQNATAIDNSSNAFTLTTTGTMPIYGAYPFNLLGTGIANDTSSNGNNWTANNISTVQDYTYDSMTDSPTVTSASVANYAVMNPLLPGTLNTYANGNLYVYVPTGSTSGTNAIGTMGASSGRWYFEVTFYSSGSTSNGPSIGVTNNYDSTGAGGLLGSYSYIIQGTKQSGGGSAVAYGSSYTNGDVIGVALDLSAGTLTFYKNNTSQGTAYTGLSGTFYPYARNIREAAYSSGGYWNFGQQPFTYTPPTGFNALNTYNLPTVTIPNGALYMAVSTWTGAGTTGTGSITNGGNNTIGATFQPDFVWAKARSQALSNALFNSVVGGGAQKGLISNATNSEASTNFDTTNGYLSSFDASGFSYFGGSAPAYYSSNGTTYVGWQWKAGGAGGVSNTNGSITSTVSANTTAGFSVVTYTGTAANATVGHGLGVAPSMIIAKVRNGTGGWPIYHISLGATNVITLESSAASSANATVWNNTAPTSSVFSIGSAFSASNYVAYCFAAIPGYSAFGSYTGNASTDGPFVYCGFRPRFVLLKNTSQSADWFIVDTSRNPYNAAIYYLQPDTSSAEASGVGDNLDFLSNGFKIKTTNLTTNGSGNTIVYAAFAENPFNSSRAR